MEKIRASVPAKVILFGEHFVVYGTRALAAAIDRRLVVEVSESETKGYHVKIENIPTFGLELDLDLKLEPDLEAGKGDGIFKKRRFGLNQNSKVRPYKDYDTAAEALAYVKGSIEYFEERYEIGIGGTGVEIEIKSGIPLSVGLGSSAATCVATIAVLREYFGIERDLEAIRRDAYNVENAVQGVASPIDTAISTYGGYVSVERTEVKRQDLPELKLIVGSIGRIPLSMATAAKASEIGLKTKKIVERVKGRRASFKRIFNSLSDASDRITEQAIRAIEERDFVTCGALMNVNHGLLDAIGVVPRKLSELVKVSQELGALGAKVTGAGGRDEMGGVGSVLVLPGESVDQIKAAMEIVGALVMGVQTGGEGLEILRL